MMNILPTTRSSRISSKPTSALIQDENKVANTAMAGKLAEKKVVKRSVLGDISNNIASKTSAAGKAAVKAEKPVC